MIVFFVIADSLKAGAPGFAGGEAKTPTLDSLAREGTVFDNVFPSGAWTIPSLMAMLTGTYGHQIGVCRWRAPFPARKPTLLTAFRAAGFDVNCFHPYPDWGFLTVPGKGVVGNSQDPKAVEAALKRRDGRDKLVVLHHWWTHLPYINSELSVPKWYAACDFVLESLGKYPERMARKTEEVYLNSVRYFSEELLPRYMEAASYGGEEVTLILTGDHGETWGKSLPAGRRVENVYDLHGRWITDETIKVPLLFWGKGKGGSIPRGSVLGGFAQGIDLGPTICELASVPWPGPIPTENTPSVVERDIENMEMVGHSLMESIGEGRPAPNIEALIVSSHNTRVPRTYPEIGKEMWRTFALRTSEFWYEWDGIEKQGLVSAPDGTRVPPPEDASRVFDLLEKQRLSAFDEGKLVEDEYLDTLRANSDEAIVEERLRSLGYLD